MEDTFSLILHGCKLAKDLESNLGNLANQPDILSKSCDNIIKIFANAKERLNAQDPALFTHHLLGKPQNSSSQQQLQTNPSLQEWLKYGVVVTQAMDMIQQQHLAGKTPFEINEMGGKKLLEGSAASAVLKGSIGGEIQAMDVSNSGRGSSSTLQRSRRRKDDEDKFTMTVPAPQMGNTDLPPEDNHTWRKYGQKEILGSRYPRSYYRCTHQKMYNCHAKKQVQRLDNDFYTFEVTYIGHHTCHMSSTAPSIPPSPPLLEISRQDQMIMTQPVVTQPTPTSSSSVPLGRWLSMEFSLGSGGSGSSGEAGGSTTANRYGRDVEYPAVVDMADAMFNSGSSSSNSMDFIFPCVEDKWEAKAEAGAGAGAGAGEKKN
ncbi:hypothetical protein CRYUN_Cryun41cG0075200 [Craigia yunnanensis]